MLGSLASYIFGAAAENTEGISMTDNEDWVIVGKADEPLESAKEDICERLPTLAIAESNAIDGSWHVSPAPITGQQVQVAHALQTSPLENLLIEHPSMSVYCDSRQPDKTRTPPQGPITRAKSRKEAGGKLTRTQMSRKVRTAPRRPAAVAARAGLPAQVVAIKSEQQARSIHCQAQLTRNQLDRTNKVRMVDSAGQRPQRRCDHQLKHSGANNNRKC